MFLDALRAASGTSTIRQHVSLKIEHVRQRYEHYPQLAERTRDDRVARENYWQHAEHFNLSETALKEFTQWFLSVCLDVVPLARSDCDHRCHHRVTRAARKRHAKVCKSLKLLVAKISVNIPKSRYFLGFIGFFRPLITAWSQVRILPGPPTPLSPQFVAVRESRNYSTISITKCAPASVASVGIRQNCWYFFKKYQHIRGKVPTNSWSIVMALTDSKLRYIKPQSEDFKLADGGGLHLLVRKTGGKLWRLSYRFNGETEDSRPWCLSGGLFA
ncbi:MAG TPA: DUF4167 domain-containing protein [Devosia sp.]|nr:DUF4167 domain-containing protein [Devosia sp.]